jgi:hypothetical protein
MNPTTIILGSLAIICFSLHVLLERKGGGTLRERALTSIFFWVAIILAVAAIALKATGYLQ